MGMNGDHEIKPKTSPAAKTTTTIYICYMHGKYKETSCGHKHRSVIAGIKCRRAKEKLLEKYNWADSFVVAKYND